MAGNSRSELASSSPEGSSFAAAYPNGQRGSHTGASLERSGSFRESIDNRVLPSGAGVARSPASIPTMEIPSPSQCLMLEPLSLGDQKCTRAVELRRVLGFSLEEHLFGPMQCKLLTPVAVEELKRFKASVLETTTKARERTKALQESLAKLERYRNLISRRRQRNDIPTGERSGGANLMKMGSQIHQNPSDLVAQRLEERAKNIVPNKRMRSSVGETEARATVPLRQSPAVEKDKNVFLDRDKNMLKACNGVLMPVEDKIRTLSAGGEGWEKKMKRKRSVGAVTRIVDGDREFKPAVQRLNNDTRPRPSNGLSFRPVSSSGIIGTGKNDGSSQSNGGSGRTILRNEFDNGSIPNDRRERSVAQDKERSVAKGGNKLNIREDTQIGTQSPLLKGKASRGPRSASSSLMNSLSNFSRTSGGIDGWDQSACLNKVQPLNGANNRKRPLSESSSPPVTQWGGPRPPKSTRSRRINLVSPVSNHDDAQALAEVSPPTDVGARGMSTEASGPIVSRGMSSSQQLKLKLENVLSPLGVSESEESGAAENRSKEKGLDTGEMEDAAVNAVQKVATSTLPSKKNKLSSREAIGDGVRRQGRSGRGSAQPKAGVSSSKEKLENVDTAKPLCTGKPISEIGKVGRPPSKKLSDRKAFTRPGHAVNSGSSDLIGESEDDHDELLVAANSACNTCYPSCPSPFWKKMEQVFSFVSGDNIAYLKRQINFAEEVDGSLCNMVDADQHDMTLVSGEKQVPSILVGMNESMGVVCSFDDSQQVSAESGKLEAERWIEKIFPLSQRLLSAFIEEDETGMYDCDTGHADVFVHPASDCSPYGIASHINCEATEADRIGSEHESELGLMTIQNCSRDNSCNGYSVPSNFRSTSALIVSFSNEHLQENNFLPQVTYSEHKDIASPAMRTDVSGSPYECHYEHMCLDDKILTELQSIGLYRDTVPGLAEGEDEEIDKNLSELKTRLYEQMRRKKYHLRQLDKAIQRTKEANERRLEQIAMDKLVEMAYKKYLGGRGSHGATNKSGANKISKQAALAFVKRVLARCRKFEETGVSCFSEGTFKEILFSASAQSTDAKSIGVLHGVASNTYAEVCNGQQEPRLGESGVLTNTTERNGPIGLKFESDSRQGLALSDQAFAKLEPITNRGKKREVLLDDVVGGTASRAPLGNSLPGGAKGKRSERDRDQNMLRNSVPKAGRPSLSSVRGERKPKAKPKQKTAQLSTSGNGLLGRFTEPMSGVPSLNESLETVNCGVSKGNEMLFPGSNASDSSKDIEETIDFTNLPLDSIEELDVGDALGGQGQDIGSWLSVDDDALQDNDLTMGLEIPMDDLSELNMNF